MTEAKRKIRRDSLIEGYREYVHAIAARMIETMRLPKDYFDEFVASGYLGLVEAAERFDFKRGKSFRNYAFLRIRGAIIDGIRRCSDLTGDAYKYAKALQAGQELREELVDLGDHTGSEKLQRIMDYAAKSALSFRLSYCQVEEEVAEVQDEKKNAEEVMIEEEEQSKFLALIEELPAQERKLIINYYMKGKTLDKISRRSSKSWASRLHNRALDTLKKRYIDYLYKEVSNAAENL